jgi:hypothetical protein
MREPAADYPLSVFAAAFRSVAGRAFLFVVTCIVAITFGWWIRIGWVNPFGSGVIPWTLLVSLISGWGALFYLALLAVLVFFLRAERGWLLLVLAFVIQIINAYLMAA